MRGKAAFGITGGMGAGAASGVVATGVGGNAVVGVAHAPKVAAGEDVGIAVGADIIDGLGIDIGGGATTGPPDIIFEYAIGSIPGGMLPPLIFNAAIISAAVGSNVPVIELYKDGSGSGGAVFSITACAASMPSAR